ncbi:Lon protease [Dissostichus eleginoides]|uniref:Lon protease n=1 Tax=Dissostichus eleginoides TaxID=100907 RepID=A0AAD9CC16_DISEL|nr:Lon protease [Dissostichus eleginoides]
MPSWLRKGKKNNTQSKNHDEEEINQLSQVSNSMADDTQPDDADPSGEAHISLILKELQDFRKDSCQQLNGIKLKVFYDDNPVVYNSAEEAAADMVKRGITVTVLKNPSSLLDQINRLTWEPSRKRGDQLHPSSKQHFKERLRGFRHRDI